MSVMQANPEGVDQSGDQQPAISGKRDSRSTVVKDKTPGQGR